MQFRAIVDDRGHARVFRLAGRLEGGQVHELMELVGEAAEAVRLDLTDLLSADASGLAALDRLERQGAALVGTSPYLALQLEIARTARTQNARGGAASTAHVTDNGTDTTNHREDE